MANNPSTESDVAKKKHFRKKNDDPLVLPKSAAGRQRMQIEKLMRNPDKPVYIPDEKKEWTPRAPAEFVRDVMGSSAGAGSGEFHVYRGYRRRENARQAYIQVKGEKDELDRTYHEKLEENQKLADKKTAKKRAKRLKQKQNLLAKKKKKEKAAEKAKRKGEGGEEGSEEESDESSSDSEKEDAQDNCFVIGGK